MNRFKTGRVIGYFIRIAHRAVSAAGCAMGGLERDMR